MKKAYTSAFFINGIKGKNFTEHERLWYNKLYLRRFDSSIDLDNYINKIKLLWISNIYRITTETLGVPAYLVPGDDLEIVTTADIVDCCSVIDYLFEECDFNEVDFSCMDITRDSGCIHTLRRIKTRYNNCKLTKIKFNRSDGMGAISSLDWTFVNMEYLREIDFGNALAAKLMLDGTFSYCTELRKVEINDVDVLVIKADVFEKCKNLEELNFGKASLDIIAGSTTYPFYGCENLRTLKCTRKALNELMKAGYVVYDDNDNTLDFAAVSGCWGIGNKPLSRRVTWIENK